MHKKFPEGTFRRIFWDQQLENAPQKNAKQYRRHPLMIKWSLNIHLMSSSAYHALRSSGFITLPSERTLRDYIINVSPVTNKNPIIWQGIRLVVSTGLKVIAITIDVTSQNLKFFKLHKRKADESKVVFKSKNVYASDD